VSVRLRVGRSSDHTAVCHERDRSPARRRLDADNAHVGRLTTA
jgi:hypothetical protein